MKFITPSWPVPASIKAYTTSKLGWGGRQAHHDLTKGNYNADISGYRAESTDLKQLLNLPAEPIWLTQTHTNLVIPAEASNRETNADASFTEQPQQICIVQTADCLPVIFTDRSGSKVAAAHAGWRGLANDILINTIKALELPPEEIIVWLGPAISKQKFEVGQDVYERFTERYSQYEVAFHKHSALTGKWFADLYLIAKIQLATLGIHAVFGGGFCTYLQDNLFFSYRRDKGNTGRMATLIWIDKK